MMIMFGWRGLEIPCSTGMSQVLNHLIFFQQLSSSSPNHWHTIFPCIYHAVASVWGLIALKLADDEIIPFNYVSYASELEVPLTIHIWDTQFASFLFVYELVLMDA
jgi:hypothetical protein